MRVTFDTNVLVSAFVAKHGSPANLLELALTVEDFEIILSLPILDELEQVLLRDEVRDRFSYTNQDVRRISQNLRASARIIPLESRFHAVKEDPKDDVILNTAYDGRSEYIVSGDRHLLKLRRFKGIVIVNPREMMEIISNSFPELVLRF
jgi:putative PIN family toxin of toxin-antitoxin system